MIDKKLTKVAMPEEDPGKVSMPEERSGKVSMPEEGLGKVSKPEETSGNVAKPEEGTVKSPEPEKQVMHRNRNFCPQCGRKYEPNESICSNCKHPREVVKKW